MSRFGGGLRVILQAGDYNLHGFPATKQKKCIFIFNLPLFIGEAFTSYITFISLIKTAFITSVMQWILCVWNLCSESIY